MLLDVEVLLQIVPALMEAEKSLVSLANRDVVAMAHADALFAMGIKNPEVMENGFKNFHAITAGFEDDMINITLKFRDGTLSMGEASKRFKSLIGDRYQKLFMAGTEAVGNPSYRDVGLTKKDMSFINKARRAEMRYYRKFLHDMANPKHMPYNQIPKDASGKMLPGYSVQKHSYVNRAKYYSQSGKAQFYNGMLAGTGSEMNIKWELGTPQTDHCPVCPIYHKRLWTWKTLPTVPRGGDTPCLFKCYCHLEFVQKTTGRTLDVPGLVAQAGTGTIQGLAAPGRYARVTDYRGVVATGIDAQMIELQAMQMNKARQMISLGGVDKAHWIALRKDLNRRIIDMAKTKGFRVQPTTSVKDLVATIQSAKKFGGTVLPLKNPSDYYRLANLDEVILVRGDFSGTGIIKVVADGRRFFVSPDGKELLLDWGGDIVFLLKKSKISVATSVKSESIKIIEAFNTNPVKVEYASLVGKDGAILFSNVKGTASQVKFNTKQRILIQYDGEVLIHNHPGSGPFSSADLKMYSYRDVKGIVVSKEYVYKISPLKGESGCPWGKGGLAADSFEIAYERLIDRKMLRYKPKAVIEGAEVGKAVQAGKISWGEGREMIKAINQKYSNIIQHEALIDLAKDWGFKYERILVSEAGMDLPPVLEAIARRRNIPVTTFFNPATLSDPVKYKSIYLRKMFNGDKELYKFFVELYKQAQEEGAFFPINIAWIRFREVYTEVEEGWEKK